MALNDDEESMEFTVHMLHRFFSIIKLLDNSQEFLVGTKRHSVVVYSASIYEKDSNITYITNPKDTYCGEKFVVSEVYSKT